MKILQKLKIRQIFNKVFTNNLANYKIGTYPTPVKLSIENVRTMTLGDNFAIFETFAGQVYGIGKNDYGQLGTGDNVGASTFVRCEELEK